MNRSTRFIISAITHYQNRGGGLERFRVDCNFEPSCSEYTRHAIAKYGALRGTAMALRRICRCTARDQVAKISDPVP